MIPTLSTPTVNSALEIDVPVSDMGNNPVVRVDYAPEQSGDGAQAC